jgi:apolipoprotein N-acyltransferase
LSVATGGQRPHTGFGLGLLTGLTSFVPLLHWSGVYVGVLPWLALATAEAMFIAVLGTVLPWTWRVRGGAGGTVLAVTGLWVAQEAARSRIPFGGFPWGRLAFSQAQAPTLSFAAWGGAPAVTAVVAAAGGLTAVAVVAAAGPVRRGRSAPFPGPRRRRTAVLALGGAVLLLGVGALLPRPLAAQDGTARVVAVQGNVPEPGLDFNARRRAVLDNHARATVAFAADVAGDGTPVADLVVWPENASDIDPLRNADAGQVISAATDAVDAPILLGAVLHHEDGTITNTSVLWYPSSTDTPGPQQFYSKQHVAPFAEYIPFRTFFRRFSELVDRVHDFTPGDRSEVFRVGRIRAGDVICFEVAYDSLVSQQVRDGANLMIVQTNNATFGYTDESDQQLAMSRLRAVETGRSVVHVSTVGRSALILPDGRLIEPTSLFTQRVISAQLPLRTELTPAVRLGARPEALLSVMAVAVLLTAVPLGARRRRRGTAAPSTRRTHVSTTEPGPDSSTDRVLVIIPTYNERENLPLIVERVRTHTPQVDILVVDDGSPDGTGQLADEMAAEDEHLSVLHRSGKQGLGAAYLHAFDWGMEAGYDVLVEMDADGSHQPEQLQALLDRVAEGADLVLGSRWVPGGQVRNWPASRQLLSRGGNTYARLALGIPLRDATGGYRAFRRTTLQQLDLRSVASQGYCFQVDLARRAVARGLQVDEVPITFVERELGNSKMSRAIVAEALWRVTQWGLRHRWNQLTGRGRRNRRDQTVPSEDAG